MSQISSLFPFHENSRVARILSSTPSESSPGSASNSDTRDIHSDLLFPYSEPHFADTLSTPSPSSVPEMFLLPVCEHSTLSYLPIYAPNTLPADDIVSELPRVSPLPSPPTSVRKCRLTAAQYDEFYSLGIMLGLVSFYLGCSVDHSFGRRRRKYFEALCSSQRTGLTYKMLCSGFFKNKHLGCSRRLQSCSKIIFKLIFRSIHHSFFETAPDLENERAFTYKFLEVLISNLCESLDLSKEKKTSLISIIYDPISQWLKNHRFNPKVLLSSLELIETSDFKLRSQKCRKRGRKPKSTSLELSSTRKGH
ncbi:hypothetical protein ADUPG1_009901 [Aduncisulcus paluster]|uniref:Uncharacterized protein n=1 Tax=Aduncisulcus paluster TaxID=2918883 RepID=A0ABQ5KX60_9EUKA|nr:hypothetical protein ADUPG1_009901 [Aduncisulcus paluster]